MTKEFKDFMDLSKRQGKVLICGEEGAGKTLLSTYIGVQKMLRGIEDCWKSFEEVDKLNELGYHFSKNYEHLVRSNFDINCEGTRIPSFKSYIIDPFRLGLYCEDYDTEILPPYSFLILTEAQTIFNAYMWQYIRPEVRRFWETSRQAKIDLIMDTNQPELVYKGMRNLINRVVFLNEDVEEIKNSEGLVVGHKLHVFDFRRYKNFERYMETGKENFVQEKYDLILRRCVYPNFKTDQCKYLHLKGREMQDYINEHFPEIKTIEDVNAFVEGFGAFVHEGYYVKSSNFRKAKINESPPEQMDEYEEMF